MRKNTIYIAIIILLASIIVFMICSSPNPYDPGKQRYEDSIKTLQAEKAQISSRIEAIEKASIIRQEQDSIKLAAQEKEISRLKVKASKAVEAIPIRVLEENPEIGLALQAKDSVITKQASLIDTLKSSLAFQIQTKNDLMTAHYDADKINTSLLELKGQRIVKLEKDLRKEQRGVKFWKAIAVTLGVGGLLLGASL